MKPSSSKTVVSKPERSLQTRYLTLPIEPSISHLHKLLHQADTQKDKTTVDYMVAAQLCIEVAAAQPDVCDEYIDRAAEQFSNVLEIAENVALSSETQVANTPRTKAGYTIRSILQSAELPLWRQAISPDYSAVSNYGDYLDAAQHANTYIQDYSDTIDMSEARTMLDRFTVLLLGERLRFQGREGWIGRMALLRQSDFGVYAQPWHIGVCGPGDTQNLINPPKKLFFHKARKFNGDQREQAAAAGVTAMRIDRSGSSLRSAEIIDYCLSELDVQNLSHDADPGLIQDGAQYLDHVSQYIHTNVWDL